MALIKENINEKGIVTNYHKIKGLTMRKIFDKEQRDAEPVEKYAIDTVIYSYVSEEKRQESEQNFAEENRKRIKVSVEEIEATPVFTLAYNKLKETDKFTGAIDC